MANAIFGWPIYSDAQALHTPPFSATIGNWTTALPLVNLQDRRLGKVARSSGVAVADTRFLIGNGTVNRPVGVVAIPKHNLSAAGTVRCRLLSGGPSLDVSLDFGTGWTSVGTPTRSAAAFTTTDGIPLDLIGDDSAAALEGYTWPLVNKGATGAVKALSIRVKQDTSTSTAIRVRDVTASADRLLGVLTWSGGLPVWTPTTGSLTSYAAVGGAFRLSFLTTAMTTANVNQVEVYPATNSALGIAATGNVYAGDMEFYGVTTDRLIADSGYVTVRPSGLDAEEIIGTSIPFVYIPTEGVFTQPAGTGWGEALFDINDTTNTAGYVELNRLVIAGKYQPAVNLSRGATLGLETETERLVTDGGAALYNPRPVRRWVMGTLDEMAEAEAFDSFWRMSKQLGTSGQLFFVYDPSDTARMHDRAFLCVFKQPSALTDPSIARYRAPFHLVEEL